MRTTAVEIEVKLAPVTATGLEVLTDLIAETLLRSLVQSKQLPMTGAEKTAESRAS